jgi:energy-coupling factor transport system permease protein
VFRSDVRAQLVRLVADRKRLGRSIDGCLRVRGQGWRRRGLDLFRRDGKPAAHGFVQPGVSPAASADCSSTNAQRDASRRERCDGDSGRIRRERLAIACDAGACAIGLAVGGDGTRLDGTTDNAASGRARAVVVARRRADRADRIGGAQPAKAQAVIRHPLAWCVWATAGLAAAFIDRNPFLQALLLLIMINVLIPYGAGRRIRIWKVGLALAVVPIIFSVALSRFGTHLLFTLPGIPIIGGRWTLDAAVFGASTGAALLLTVAIFAVLQMTVRSADLVAILPRPFYRAGTTVALALAFAPKTVASLQSIREARRLRGQRAGWRSAPQLLLPLLLTTLERALQYGESLDARGFGSRRRSRYRPVPWSIADLLIVVGSLAAVAAIVLMPPQPYNPYLDLEPGVPTVPSLLAVLLLAIPALTAGLSRMDHAAHHA